MHNMARRSRISVRELQQNLKRALGQVERGRELEVTRRGAPIARIVPLPPAGQAEPWPDLEARLRAIFGDQLMEPPPSQELLQDRD